ncbi:MAG TPA: undecaprenyl/decaprenyl-phosphate alpha-N-acetylglucosaminyl 1-phosphate transferase [Acidimicrobiales bacterium]|nr:undecaprenyl/decaprenyl-phosphate alpha-N-acetylglucosaminyl 1-phosphate transferase [Acidimicrobiales bacterium]
MIQFRWYIVVFAVAAVATWVATFAARAMAKRHSLLVTPDDRRVHERPTPTAGGAAMYFGMLVAIAVASQLPVFGPVFRGSSAPLGVVIAATVIFGVGLVDDVREMSPPAKLAGQVLAGTVLYFFGVNMLYFHVPLAQTTLELSPSWAALGTVLWVAVMANSVNFIDGLDGLAAGIVAIGAGAFFVYSHQLGVVGNIQASNAGPLIAVIAIGLCVGFLPHNFHPAKIFMGDAGSMLLGVLVAASTLAVVGQDSYQFSGRTYFFFAPIIIPFFILGIPLLDTVFAVVRRAGQRTSPAVADLSHLHHRLMRLGHGHRAAVLILWAWTALLSGLVLWPGVTDSHNEIPPIAVGALAILLYTLFAPRGRSALSNGDSDGHVGNGTNGHGSQPPRAGPSSRVTAPNPKVGASRRTFTGKPPSPVPGRGAVATGGIGSGAGRLGAQNPRSSNGVRLVLPDRPTPPAGQPAAGTPALGTPKTVAPGPPVPEGL